MGLVISDSGDDLRRFYVGLQRMWYWVSVAIGFANSGIQFENVGDDGGGNVVVAGGLSAVGGEMETGTVRGSKMGTGS